MKQVVVLLGILLQVNVLGFASDTGAVDIDPSESRALIRKEILSHTPRGSTIDQVRKFVKKQLLIEGQPRLIDAPASGPSTKDSTEKGVKSIRILLGRYVTNPLLIVLPIPLPLETDVSVQWAFDKDGKLLNVFVDKALEGS